MPSNLEKNMHVKISILVCEIRRPHWGQQAVRVLLVGPPWPLSMNGCCSYSLQLVLWMCFRNVRIAYFLNC